MTPAELRDELQRAALELGALEALADAAGLEGDFGQGDYGEVWVDFSEALRQRYRNDAFVFRVADARTTEPVFFHAVGVFSAVHHKTLSEAAAYLRGLK